MIGNFRYTGINLSGWIQGVVMLKNSIFCVFKNDCSKDNNKPAHWVGHSKLRSLDIDKFFKRTTTLDYSHSIVTGNTEEKNPAKKNTDDSDEI